MLYKNPTELIFDNIFLNMDILGSEHNIYLKLEGLSLTGSIKVKPALYMIEELERKKILKPGMSVIESSSGNLGVALSMICAIKGYKFICVSDPNISPFNKNMITNYGADIIIIDKKDENGGYLGSRISYIKSLLEQREDLIWINQYENHDNVQAHYLSTAKSIYEQFEKIDYLFIGVGTTGTLGGVSKFFREHSPNTKIIGVDSLGSVTFGGVSGKRFIPGLGTSNPPPIRALSKFDEIIYIPEIDTIKTCRMLSAKGYCFGGSTGTVLTGMQQYMDKISNKSTIVAISPDMGEKYIDTIYQESWVNKNFGE
jgi:N-(2-amino-2-carboxyethyl)-L-glutamate synthase